MTSAPDSSTGEDKGSDLPVPRPSTEVAVRSLFGAENTLPISVRTELLHLLDRYIRQNQVKRMVDLIARRQSEFRFRSVAVISKDAKEGRTFFTAVLARALVEFLRVLVLVVDATGREHIPPILEALDTGGNNPVVEGNSLGGCSVATIGDATNHSQRRNEFHFGEMVRARAAEFDVVLADTQALSVSDARGCDAALIAQQVDAYILIVADSSLSVDAHKTYLEQLGVISTPCIGIVHNLMR